MAARKRRTTLNDKWRENIRTSMLINRLESHVLGEVELTASQVSAALGLLRKTAPDLTQVDGTMEHEHEHNHTHTHVGLSETAGFLEAVTGQQEARASKEPVSH